MVVRVLTPEYLDMAPDVIVELYSQLDETIIRDIVRRLVKTGGVTPTAAWQADRLQDSGLLYDDIIRKVSNMTDASTAQVKALFEDAGIEALKYDSAIYKAAGLVPLPLAQSPAAAQVLLAGLQKTAGYLKNLSLTTAATTQTAYINAVTLAEMQAESGAFDYITAIRNAVKNAAQVGTTVLYPTGHMDKLDVAVRRATLTGISQTAAQISVRYADDMGCDLVETTAHPGARPSHAVWQGRVFSRSGNGGKKYPDFVTVTGYGSGDGLCGWNCRHSFFPYFEGLSASAYPRAKLAEYKNKTVAYNDQKVSYYDATQMQRQMERQIRATKRELAGYDEGIKSTDNEAMAAALREDFNSASVKLRAQKNKMEYFLGQTGLDRQAEREQVLGFGRSAAQKAVQANKKVAVQRQNAIIETEIKKATGIRGMLSITPQKINISALSFDNVHINQESRHGVTEQEARSYITNAKATLTRWNGKYVNYYAEMGAAYVDTETNTIRTAFKSDQFDPMTKFLIEELKKHGK